MGDGPHTTYECGPAGWCYCFNLDIFTRQWIALECCHRVAWMPSLPPSRSAPHSHLRQRLPVCWQKVPKGRIPSGHQSHIHPDPHAGAERPHRVLPRLPHLAALPTIRRQRRHTVQGQSSQASTQVRPLQTSLRGSWEARMRGQCLCKIVQKPFSFSGVPVMDALLLQAVFCTPFR